MAVARRFPIAVPGDDRRVHGEAEPDRDDHRQQSERAVALPRAGVPIQQPSRERPRWPVRRRVAGSVRRARAHQAPVRPPEG